MKHKKVISSLYKPFLVQQKVKVNNVWTGWMNINRYQSLHEAEENIPGYNHAVEKWRIQFIASAPYTMTPTTEEQEWITYYTETLNEKSPCYECEKFPMGEHCAKCKEYIIAPF